MGYHQLKVIETPHICVICPIYLLAVSYLANVECRLFWTGGTGWRHPRPKSLLDPIQNTREGCIKKGLIYVKEEERTWFSKGCQGCSKGFPV